MFTDATRRAADDFADATDRFRRAHRRALPSRWLHPVGYAQASARRVLDVRRAEIDELRSGLHLIESGAGSVPGRWGVFSVATGPHGRVISLEYSMTQIVPREQPSIGTLARALAMEVTGARAKVVRGEPRQLVEGWVERSVFALFERQDQPLRAALMSHLPGRARPLPVTIDRIHDVHRPSLLNPVEVELAPGSGEAEPTLLARFSPLPGWLTGLGIEVESLDHVTRSAASLGARLVVDGAAGRA